MMLVLVGASLGFVLGATAGGWVMMQMALRVETAAAKRWEHVVAAQHAIGGDLVTRAIYGGEPGPARVERTESPEERLESAISEDTIRNGMAELRRGYEANGVMNMTDEELREEAVMIASGINPFGAP